MAYPPLIAVNIDVKAALVSLDSLAKQLEQKEIRRALSSSINRTMISIRAKIVKEIPKVYTVKGYQVRDRFSFSRSNPNTLVGKVKGVSNRISMSNFDSKLQSGGEVKRITRTRKSGVFLKSRKISSKKNKSLFVKVYKGGKYEEIKSAFIMKKGSSIFYAARGYYKKTDEYQKFMYDFPKKPSSGKVRGLLTNSVWDMAMNKKVQLPTSVDAQIVFAKRLEAELKYRIGKVKKQNITP
jgi:hypothetical protein